MKKAIFSLTCMMLFTVAVCAQVKFYTGLSDQRISGNQTFQIQYVVEGATDIKHFMVPDLPGFRVLDAFDHSGSTLGQPGNKLVSVYARVLVLVPKKHGEFTIPGATAIIDGKKRRSNDVRLVVQQPGAPPYNGLSNSTDINTDEESVIRPGETADEKVKKNFFLKVDVNKTTCYVGEPLMAVYKLYTRLNASSEVVRRPSFTGFSVTEMVDAYDGRPQAEMLDGVPYYSILIRKVQLFPLQEGEFELDKAEIESVIHFYQQPDNVPPGAPFYFGTAVEHHVDLSTTPVKITVKPLPEKQPESYNGAVGKFNILLKTPKKPIHQGDLVKLQLTVTGNGNIPLLTPPEVKWPKGIDTVEPAVTEETDKYNFPLSGNKTFEYSFAARDTGNYIIPTIRFPYYNVDQHAYQYAETNPVDLHVLPAVEGSRKGAKAVGQTSEGDGITVPRQLYWFALVVIIIVAWICYQVWGLHKSTPVKKTALPEQEPLKRENLVVAPATATDLLAGPQAALQQEDGQLFYHQLKQALWNLAAAKCNLLPLSLNKHNIAVQLRARNVPEETISEFMDVSNECEWALYAPGQTTSDMKDLLERARRVIAELLAV